MQDENIASLTVSVKESLSEAPLTQDFLAQNNISADEPGVEALFVLEKSFRKFNLEQERMKQSILPRFDEFLKQRTERMGKERRENDRRAKMQDLTLKLSKSSEIAITAYRNEHHLMRFPLFSTAKGKRSEPIRYEFTDAQGFHRFLVVRGTADLGIANQRDGDVLRYALTKMGEIALQTGYYPRNIEVSGYEILKALGKGDSKRDYDWLVNSMRRLSSTTVETNIFTSDPNNPSKKFMGTLASFEYLENGGIASRITISLAPTLFVSASMGGLLKIDKSVILESGNLKKALLERIQVHLGKQSFWSISLQKLAKMCAFDSQLWRFKEELKRARLPYTIQFYKNSLGEEIVTFNKDTSGDFVQ